MNNGEESMRLIRNLKDAGCDPRQTEQFLALRQEGKLREQLRLLAKRRSGLLEKIHTAQKQIDCLDYLAFQLKQEITTNTGR